MKHVFLILLFFVSYGLSAQRLLIEGQVVDSLTGNPMPNATVSLAGTTFKATEHTGANGNFAIKGVRKGTYKLYISFLAYQTYEKEISIESEKINLGKILLAQQDLKLNEVNVVGYVTPVTQKGDTTEMSAASYKVNADADAIDLVKKMPGITIENGKVKAHGEELKKVLVDGKDFFGDDVALSLQNLSSDMIDKVQVYNKLSDQSEFIGFDDGQGEKVMNIVTRPDRRAGKNAKITAGTDFDSNYLINGRLNVTNKKGNLTITGGSNNVNQQNFSMRDIFQGGGNRGFYGRSSGLNTLHSLGLNYSGNVTDKLKVSASYFFNWSENYTLSETSKELFGEIDTMFQARYEESINSSTRDNQNHRINATIEYKIDSLNSIIYRQNLSFQTTDYLSAINASNFNIQENPLLQTVSENGSYSSGLNYSGSFTYRHKFLKQGRTFSLGLQYSGNTQNSDATNISNSLIDLNTINLNQSIETETKGNSYSANLVYTEPITGSLLIMGSYTAGMNPNLNEKFVYNNLLVPADRIDSISNARESNYLYQKSGLSLLIQKGKDLNASVGVEYQYSKLAGDQSYPEEYSTSKVFRNVLPNARLNYKISKKSSIRTVYRTSTSAPSITQLQPVIDITNPGNFYLGNPALNPEYTHTLFSNFRYANSENFTNFGFNVFGSYTLDPIGKETELMDQDTVIFGQTLRQYGQLLSLKNLPDSWNIRGFVNYGFLFKPIKCNLNFNLGAGYNTMPGIFNKVSSTTRSTDLSGGLVIASNISEYIDFTISYNGNYTISKNSLDLDLNSKTWRHTIGLSSTLSTKKGQVLSNSLSEQIITGLGSNYNQDYLIWNISLGQKLFKNKSGQIAIQVNDVLDQNKDISRSVTDYYVADSRTNTIGRYAMLTFTYTLKTTSGKGKGPDERFGPDGPRMGPPPPHGGF